MISAPTKSCRRIGCGIAALVPQPAEEDDLDYPLDGGELDADGAGVGDSVAVGVGYRNGDNCRAGSEAKRLVACDSAIVVNADRRRVGGCKRHFEICTLICGDLRGDNCCGLVAERHVTDRDGFYLTDSDKSERDTVSNRVLMCTTVFITLNYQTVTIIKRPLPNAHYTVGDLDTC